LLPLDLVSSAATRGLLTPLPESVPDDRVGSTFTFARQSVVDGTDVWAVPVAVDVLHAVSRDTAPPSTWEELLEDGPYVMPVPGAEPEGLAHVLSLYVSSGGDINSLVVADRAAVSDTFGFLSEGIQSGAITAPEAASTPRGSWNEFLTAEQPAAVTSGGVFAPQQANFPGLVWGPLPGPTDPAPPIGWGWAAALSSPDPARLEDAARLVTWLSSPEKRGWVLPFGYLQASSSDWQLTTGELLDPPAAPEYLAFLELQLATALSASRPEEWSGRWSAATVSVLAGDSVESAVAELVP
jgi:ABC-type glycerol-3-phosphate transport system substrate-binding protein